MICLIVVPKFFSKQSSYTKNSSLKFFPSYEDNINSLVNMKDKPNSTRIYDEDGFRRRAACICVRNDSDEVIIILLCILYYNLGI